MTLGSIRELLVTHSDAFATTVVTRSEALGGLRELLVIHFDLLVILVTQSGTLGGLRDLLVTFL